MKTPHTHAKKEALFSYRVDLRIGPTNWSDGGIELETPDLSLQQTTNATLCRTVMLSRFAALSASLTWQASPLQTTC